MADQSETPLNLNSILLLVLTALLSSHALDLGQLGIIAWDILIHGEPTKTQFQVEAGLLVAGVGLVILAVIGARNALVVGDVNGTNTVLASLVTGLIGLSFSILDKTADQSGVPTHDTARGLIFVLVGGCVLLPPYLAMPSTRSGFRMATATLARVGTAGLVALLLGLALQLAFLILACICTGACSERLETEYLKIGATSFFISAPSAAAFAAAMAVLAVDPQNYKNQWVRFSANKRLLWLLGMLLVAATLSMLYSLGSYYPEHGEIVTPSGEERSGWLRQVPGAELGRGETALLLFGLQMPGLVSAIFASWISPTPPQGRKQVVRDLALLVSAACFGGVCAWAVTVQVQATGQLLGKESLFIAAHATTSVFVTISAWTPKFSTVIGKRKLVLQ